MQEENEGDIFEKDKYIKINIIFDFFIVLNHINFIIYLMCVKDSINN